MTDACPICRGSGYWIYGAPPEGFGDNSTAVLCRECDAYNEQLRAGGHPTVSLNERRQA